MREGVCVRGWGGGGGSHVSHREQGRAALQPPELPLMRNLSAVGALCRVSALSRNGSDRGSVQHSQRRAPQRQLQLGCWLHCVHHQVVPSLSLLGSSQISGNSSTVLHGETTTRWQCVCSPRPPAALVVSSEPRARRMPRISGCLAAVTARSIYHLLHSTVSDVAALNLAPVRASHA